MSSLERIFRNLLGSVSQLDNKTQFSIVGGFLILYYIFGKMRKHRKNRSLQSQQIRKIASLLVDKDRQKRDGIIWFFQLFLFMFFATLFTLIGVYFSSHYQYKPVKSLAEFFKTNLTTFGFYLKISLGIEIMICIILYKLIYYYDNKIVKEVVLNDQQAQEQNDKLNKDGTNIAEEQQNDSAQMQQKEQLKKNMTDSKYQESQADKKND